MFARTDFWIGLAVGAVAGVFGYKMMNERCATQQVQPLVPQQGTGEIPLAELMRQKEQLEDLIAAQEAAAAQAK
ncbi:MAG: ribosomal protein [Firmicutes bacterium]|nr:ribosomal protein [Bacillota bacterium]